MNVLKYNYRDNLEQIVEMLKLGKLVVYPTDTIYGIAADINNTHALKKVFQVKKRSYDKAVSICFHDIDQLKDYVYLTNSIKNVIEKSLPGPYTFLLRKKDTIDPILTSNSDIVGIRIPDNLISHELTKNFPITSTSANISNKNTPNNINDINKQLRNNIDIYIDYGVLKNSLPSTIIDLTKNKPIIIRKGLCDENLLNNILKVNL